MSATLPGAGAEKDLFGEAPAPGRNMPVEKTIKLWSGVVLFVFVATHLTNHAVGIFGLGPMDVVQEWRWYVWKSTPGTILLYSAAIAHVVLAMKRIVTRQTWRMPIDELVQIVFGLLIPVFVISHILQTRIAGSYFGVDETYGAVLWRLWPSGALWQIALMTVAWTHGCIGIHHAFRHRLRYGRLRMPALLIVVLLPALAVAGFVSAGREVHLLGPAPAAPTPQMQAGMANIAMKFYGGLVGAGALALVVIGFGAARRRAARQIVINYRGRGPVRVPRGTSVLEASRIHGIPHPSVCGGRGRCSTCRVHVLSALSRLPEPNVTERAMLARISAQPQVRLACQLRPTDNINVRILMPVLGRKASALAETAGEDWAVQRDATVLSFDLRAFNAMTRSQLPYEIAVLVNRLFTEMKQAIEHYGGRVDNFFGNGFVAVFDKEGDATFGSRSALLAAGDMARVLATLNREMGSALPIPIRAGVGVHTGPTIIAKIGDDLKQADVMALGPTVTIAAAMQDATREALVDYIVSEAAALASGFNFGATSTRTITVDRLDTSITAFALADRRALFAVIGAASAAPAEAESA